MIKPEELYKILMGFTNGDSVECPRHCTECKLLSVCDAISGINEKLASEYGESLKVATKEN